MARYVPDWRGKDFSPCLIDKINVFCYCSPLALSILLLAPCGDLIWHSPQVTVEQGNTDSTCCLSHDLLESDYCGLWFLESLEKSWEISSELCARDHDASYRNEDVKNFSGEQRLWSCKGFLRLYWYWGYSQFMTDSSPSQTSLYGLLQTYFFLVSFLSSGRCSPYFIFHIKTNRFEGQSIPWELFQEKQLSQVAV